MASKGRAASGSNPNILKLVKSEIKDITAKEHLADDSKGFIFWILVNYFDLDRESAATSVVDSPNDKRVDALIEDDEAVKILQCKFCENDSKEIGEKEIVLFKGCIDWLKNPEEVKKLNLDRLYDAALTFTERWDEGGDIQLHYFALGRFNSAAEHERIVFNNSDIKDRVQMYFHNADGIYSMYKIRSQTENPLAEESITLNLAAGEYFVKKGNMRSIVATIKGKDLYAMYNKYGDNLFERNIRLYRGARKGSINEKIIETILNDTERKKFWHYNNGMSFVCRDFSVNEDASPPTLTVQGFQVINGCQTTVCLSEARSRVQSWPGIPEDVEIVVRFIIAPIKEVDLITLYTNSQNPVSEIQLKSNCPIQKKLKDNLYRHHTPYFYSIKEGDRRKLSSKERRKFGDRIIELSEIAQAIYSLTTDPAFARRWKNRLFSEKYHEVFRKDISVAELILPWRILKVINEKIARYRRDEFHRQRKEPASFTEEQRADIKKREFLIYSNLIILYFIGKLIKKRYKQYSAAVTEKLLNNRLEGRIGRIFDYIVGILQFSEKLKLETNLPRFLKNIDNINSLYDEIHRQLTTDQARTGKDPLHDMLPEIRGYKS